MRHYSMLFTGAGEGDVNPDDYAMALGKAVQVDIRLTLG